MYVCSSASPNLDHFLIPLFSFVVIVIICLLAKANPQNQAHCRSAISAWFISEPPYLEVQRSGSSHPELWVGWGPSDFWHNPVLFWEKEHTLLPILIKIASQDLLPPPFLGSSSCKPPRKERPLSWAILVSGVGICRAKVTMVC